MYESFTKSPRFGVLRMEKFLGCTGKSAFMFEMELKVLANIIVMIVGFTVLLVLLGTRKKGYAK